MTQSLESYFSGIRSQFPALKQVIEGKDLVYLDSTNTTLKPYSVIDRITQFYTNESTNVHRGGYQLSNRTTQNFESSRLKISKFLGAASADEIVFVRGTTEAINLVANSWGNSEVKLGDEILITEMEHHANIVPWQMLAERKGARLVVAKILDNGELDLADLKVKLNSKTKILAFTACSNTLGTITPFEKIIQLAHQVGAKVLLDGAQLVAQKKIEVAQWGADFFVFSGHKIFGPTGIGVLYAHKEILEKMPPYQGGGSMISEVTFEKTTYNEVPLRFEAGTPHIEGVIGLRAAIDFLESLQIDRVQAWEHELLLDATERLLNIPGITIYGTAAEKAPIISFNLKGAHHSDVAQILDQQGVCVRSGHHCTQPLMKRLNITGSVRASFSIYNTKNDILALESALLKAKELLL